MSRSDTERDIIETLGQVPVFFKEHARRHARARVGGVQGIPDGRTPPSSAREKQLIGYAVAAAIHCPYCTYFHQSATEMMGTNREQLEEAARMAADTAKYSTYLHGLQVPIEDFKKQSDEMGEYLAAHQPQEESRARPDPREPRRLGDHGPRRAGASRRPSLLQPGAAAAAGLRRRLNWQRTSSLHSPPRPESAFRLGEMWHKCTGWLRHPTALSKAAGCRAAPHGHRRLGRGAPFHGRFGHEKAAGGR